MRKDIKIVLESIWYLILPVFIFVLNVRYWHGYLANPGWSLTSQPPQACDFSHELGGFSLDL